MLNLLKLDLVIGFAKSICNGFPGIEECKYLIIVIRCILKLFPISNNISQLQITYLTQALPNWLLMLINVLKEEVLQNHAFVGLISGLIISRHFY